MTAPKSRQRPWANKPWVRFRVFVEGRKVDDALLILSDDGLSDILGPLASRHGDICAAAESTGRPYMVEVEFWDGEFVRWGTDPDGMVEPVPMRAGLAALLATLEKRWGIS